MNLQRFFEILYADFNNRNIDKVIANMSEDVQWANGMEGGYVYGHNGVREYWLKQFKSVSSNVTPLEITEIEDSAVIKVHQVVHDTDGNLLADEIVEHIFTLTGDKISGFDIGSKISR